MNEVRPSRAPATPSRDVLASVIPLDASRRNQPTPEVVVAALPGPAPAGADPAAQACALSILGRRAGERGLELPDDAGRLLARLETLLADGPSAVDTERVLPALAAEITGLAISAGTITLDLVPEEAEVLGAALGVDLSGLRLDVLHEVAGAVIAVSQAPRAVERWGQRRAADAAEAVITAVAGDLREAARTHEWLYEHFTDRVWDIPAPLLERGRRSWRVIARARLSQRLREASRTGRLGGRLTTMVAGIAEARRARERVAAVAPLLSQHLGALHQGPLSNADAALRAVGAVRRLQAALGDLLAADRLSRLILADAFRSEDVWGSAVNLRRALDAWDHDVASFGGQGAWAMTVGELADWVEECRALLPELRAAAAAAEGVGATVGSLRVLVDLHLLREHVAELTAAQGVVAQHAALEAVAFSASQDEAGVGT
jgi:hypothetical protein